MCTKECEKKNYCSAWCVVESECIMTSFLMSPQDRPDTDTIDCYTNRQAGNHMVTAIGTGSPSDGNRPASILTKGIYNYHYGNTVAAFVENANGHMLFEFPSEVLVSIIRSKLMDYEPQFPSAATEIRLGSSYPGPSGLTDFSQLDLIGTLPNPQASEWRTLNVNPPKTAKFLAILETDRTQLAFSFIEVFS